MTPAEHIPEEDTTITVIGRKLLLYLHHRSESAGLAFASYRQARMDVMKMLESGSGSNSSRFNWGFETVFTQEIHVLEQLGLVAVKYGSGAIMAGRGSKNQIYNVSLTDDGIDTARVIHEREAKHRAETERLDKQKLAEMEKDADSDDSADDEVSTRVAEGDEDTSEMPDPDEEEESKDQG